MNKVKCWPSKTLLAVISLSCFSCGETDDQLSVISPQKTDLKGIESYFEIHFNTADVDFGSIGITSDREIVVLTQMVGLRSGDINFTLLKETGSQFKNLPLKVSVGVKENKYPVALVYHYSNEDVARVAKFHVDSLNRE